MGFKHFTLEVFYDSNSLAHKICDKNNGEDPTCQNKYYTDINIIDHLTYFGFDMTYDILRCQL